MKPGKQFERDIKSSSTKTVNVLRLEDGNDNTTPPQPADFLMFDGEILAYIECKSYLGDSIPMAKLTQIDDMFEAVNGWKNTEGYFLLNFREHDETYSISVEMLYAIKHAGIKGIYLSYLKATKNTLGSYFQDGKFSYDLSGLMSDIKAEKHYK